MICFGIGTSDVNVLDIGTSKCFWVLELVYILHFGIVVNILVLEVVKVRLKNTIVVRYHGEKI